MLIKINKQIMTNKKTAKLILENKELELDIITGSENESAIDITV